MNSNNKRAICLVLSLILVLFGAVACAQEELTPEQMLERSQLNMAEANSIDMNMNMAMDMSLMGQSAGMSTDVSMTAFTNPAKLRMIVSMETAGQNVDVEIYSEETAGGTAMYFFDGTSWSAQTMNSDQYAKTVGEYDVQASLGEYLKSFEGVALTGAEQRNGMDTLRLDGILNRDAMKEILNQESGLSDIVKSSGGQITQTDVDAIFAALEDVPVTLWLDAKNYNPVRYEMDLTSSMSGVYQSLFSALDMGEDMLSVDKMFIAIDVKSIGSAVDFAIPEGALAAK